MTTDGKLLASAEVPPDVVRIAWSPDGSRVAVSCWRETDETVLRSVSMVDAATGAITWTRPVYSGANDLAFSPDGLQLAMAGYAVDQVMVRVLDAGSGEPVWTRDDDAPRGMCYSPDGTRLAMGYLEGLMVVEAGTGDVAILLERPMQYPFVAAFSPGGRWFAADSNHGLYVVDMATGQIAWTYAQSALAIAFSDDESRLTAVTGHQEVVIFDCAKGTPMMSAPVEHALDSALESKEPLVVLSPDGQRFAGLSYGALTVGRVRDGRRVHPPTPSATPGPQARTRFSPAGHLLAHNSAGDAPGVLALEVATGAVAWRDASAPVSAVAFDPAGTRLAVGGAGLLRIHRLDPLVSRYPAGGRITGVALTTDGIRLAAVAAAGGTTVFGADDGDPLSEYEVAGTVNTIAFSPDGGRYATGSADGVVRVRETVSGGLRKFTQQGPVNALAFAAPGIVTASSDRTVRMLSLPGDPAEDLLEETWRHTHTRPVNLLAVSPDERWVAFAGSDHAVVVLGADGAEACRIQHDQRVAALSFGALLASGSADGTVRLIDPRRGQVAEINHPASVTAVAIIPDGALLATADQHRTVRVYDTTAAPPQQLGGLTLADTVAELAFHPTARRLAIVPETSPTVRITDPLEGFTEAIRLIHPAPILHLVFSRTGDLLATTCADDLVRIHPGSPP